jgi:phosphoribosylaminoimidazolecarboxamide formyltransferase/IMP cyclohydrolase
MGCGQPNRVTSVKLAIEKARENLKEEYTGHADESEAYIRYHLASSLLLSEAFFPFADNIEICHEFGIRQIVQPGGSLRDKEVIEACDRLGLSMMFTGLRHFKH